MSASLYLTVADKNPQRYVDFWNDERSLLIDRNAQGFRAIDAGPVTMGYRLSNSRTGSTSRGGSSIPKVHTYCTCYA